MSELQPGRLTPHSLALLFSAYPHSVRTVALRKTNKHYMYYVTGGWVGDQQDIVAVFVEESINFRCGEGGHEKCLAIVSAPAIE